MSVSLVYSRLFARAGVSPVSVRSSDRLHWACMTLVLTLLLPTSTSFMLGSLRLCPYRVVLLFAFTPLALGVRAGRYGRPNVVDALMLLQGLWAILALTVNHDLGLGLQTGGIYLVETFGAYLIGRCLVRTPSAVRALFSTASWALLVLLPLAIIETTTGFSAAQQAFAILNTPPHVAEVSERLGMHRAFGPMDHPILWGVFTASFVAPVWYLNMTHDDRITPIRLLRTSVPVLAAATSLSSGAFAAMAVQVLLIGWERMTRGVHRRWLRFVVLIAVLYFLVDMLSNRSGLKVLLSYLTLSPETAYLRTIIWDWGINCNVAEHPIFGIGQNEWVRPSWMFSTSMDNFWLVCAVTFGLPAAVSLLSATVLAIWQLGSQIDRVEGPCAVYYGLAMSLVALSIAGATVHYWNAALAFFAFIVGVAAGSVTGGPTFRKLGTAWTTSGWSTR